MKREYWPYFIISLSFAIVIGILISSCQHEAVNKNELRKINFEREVLPIFKNNCTANGCHGSSGGETDFTLDSYAGIMSGITKGDASASSIYSAITATWSGIMPPKKALSSSQIATIKLWIEQGAENSLDTTKTIDTIKVVSKSYPVCFSRDILPIVTSKCSKCHTNLISYSVVKSIVKPGNPNNSELYKVITESGEDRMPQAPNPSLSKANIDSIYNWIKAGALDEKCPTLCDTSKYTFASFVFPIINANCTGCHSGSSARGGIKLEDYSTISSVAKNGKLVNVIKGSGARLMPPNGSLSSCDITVIENWVINKSLNN